MTWLESLLICVFEIPATRSSTCRIREERTLSSDNVCVIENPPEAVKKKYNSNSKRYLIGQLQELRRRPLGHGQGRRGGCRGAGAGSLLGLQLLLLSDDGSEHLALLPDLGLQVSHALSRVRTKGRKKSGGEILPTSASL